MKYYDITFHELSGKNVVKRSVPSSASGFEVWKDACVSYTEEEILLLVNEGTYVTLKRQYIVRIDAKEVEGPVEKLVSRQDEIMGVVNTLSNMGF
ncbi:hypothetical protein IGI37_003657 [Enterococcus sp. AZ194]|uniref:hypothetical protein n=1 Tax=Enterococcus sp. AZ194 TaxID=2774629 RepID=UPI003F224CA6